MLNLVAVLIIVVAVILAGMTSRLVCGWLKYRGRMLITCPENQRPAGVSVDPRHAAATSLAGKPEFHLTHCSRWPENAGCGRECLRDIETSPENCLLHNILVAWVRREELRLVRPIDRRYSRDRAKTNRSAARSVIRRVAGNPSRAAARNAEDSAAFVLRLPHR